MKLNKIEKRKKFFVFSLLPMTAKSKMRLESNYWVKANEGTISCNMILDRANIFDNISFQTCRILSKNNQKEDAFEHSFIACSN